MKVRTSLALTVSLVAVAAPGIAFANSPWHPTNGEVGFTYHPEHYTSQRSRAEVLAELDAAKRDGTLALTNRGIPLSPKASGPTRTRAEVVAEVLNETREERQARRELYRGG